MIFFFFFFFNFGEKTKKKKNVRLMLTYLCTISSFPLELARQVTSLTSREVSNFVMSYIN